MPSNIKASNQRPATRREAPHPIVIAIVGRGSVGRKLHQARKQKTAVRSHDQGWAPCMRPKALPGARCLQYARALSSLAFAPLQGSSVIEKGRVNHEDRRQDRKSVV